KRCRERDVRSFLADDGRGQFLRRCSLLLVEQEELLSRESRKQEKGNAPRGDLAVRIDEERRDRDVQRHRDEDSAPDPRDLTDRTPAKPRNNRSQYEVAALLYCR